MSLEKKPVYVIGSEVPVPGGPEKDENAIQPTSAKNASRTLKDFQSAFLENGLSDAWERVIALVVQPGVEYADNSVVVYNRKKVAALCSYIRTIPNIILEGHSTDYQPRSSLKQLMDDCVAILKVGPALHLR